MTDNFGDCIAFVIDTDQYAGNFEREMCAHLTGRYGDCEVGRELVEEGIPELFKNVMEVADEHGCYRPVSIFPLKDTVHDYQAVAIFFYKEQPPTKVQIELMKERAKTFLHVYRTEGRMAQFRKDKVINITGFRLIEFSTASKEIEI